MAAAGSHPAVVRYYSAWTEQEDRGGQHFYILMELCGASLHDMRTGIEGHNFHDTELLDILRQARRYFACRTSATALPALVALACMVRTRHVV